MPIRLVAVLTLLAVVLSGCVASPADRDCDGVADARDAWVADGCAPSPARAQGAARVGMALVGTDASALPRAEALRDSLLASFRDATGGRLAAVPEGPVVLVPPPAGLAALDDAPATLTRLALARGLDDASLLVVVTDGSVEAASARCGCLSWHVRPRDAPDGFLGTLALGSVDEPADELSYRFLHEAAHAWCCRLDAGHPLAPLVDGHAHWAVGDAADPLVGDGSDGRRPDAPRYSDVTLVLMGALPPRHAAPLRTGDGLVSGLDVARAFAPTA